jgi:hypothetical protein
MGAFKSFEAKDIISTPFIVNKGFSFYGDSEFTGSGLDKFIGLNQTGLFSTSTKNDILDYSLNIFKSQSDVSIINANSNDPYYFSDYTIVTDPSNLIDPPTSGFINFPQNTYGVETYCTFSGNYSFLTNRSVDTYNIFSILYLFRDSTLIVLEQDLLVTNSLSVEGIFVTKSFEYSGSYTPEAGDNLIATFLPYASNAVVGSIDTLPLTFQELNISFVISSQSLAPSSSQPFTGINNTVYQRSIYDSIKQLYYTNYIGNPYPAPSYYTGSDTYTQFDNYLQSFPLDIRQFPTESNAKIGVISIPSLLYGEYIKPNSFLYQSASVYVYDDGEGNLLNSINNTKCGNVVYSHGLAVITTASFISDLEAFITSSNTTCSFSSSMTLFETQYKCTIRENEFNFSQNPTIISGSNGELYGFATLSYFDPYITTVGLYNENQDLLAVAKLSQPLPSSRTTDTNIIIRMDK